MGGKGGVAFAKGDYVANCIKFFHSAWHRPAAALGLADLSVVEGVKSL
jgi:hypothetical protein